ncbi:hypothetical protein NKJ84_31450 [Mesorhizobium sp. M0048]|uniref:hypothetical protein n=1 Tax=Mesorhizobium sp. M0048 TaxID=2956860 RepID=UPI003339403C
MDTEKGPLAMVRLLVRIIGVGIETADMLVNEILSHGLRDRKAVARYAGLAGAPDVLGLGSSAIGALVERTIRFTMLLHLPRLEHVRFNPVHSLRP